MQKRAYTYVDRCRAVVGNAWIERSWSAFLGNTNSLLQFRGEFEWVVNRCPEFEVSNGSINLDVMDFADVEWSEENGPLGATLSCRQMRAGLEVVIETLAYHENPGMRRKVAVRNTGSEAVVLRRARIERLPLMREGLRVLTHGFEREHESVDWETDERGLALDYDGRGIIVGVDGGAHYSVFTRDEALCSIALHGPKRLEPGEAWRMPAAYVLPYAGDLADASRTIYAELMMNLRGSNRRKGEPEPGLLPEE